MTVEVTKQCMEPLPEAVGALAAGIDWPDPNEDGTTTLPVDTLRQVRAVLNALVGYIETQLDRCRMPDAETTP